MRKSNARKHSSARRKKKAQNAAARSLGRAQRIADANISSNSTPLTSVSIALHKRKPAIGSRARRARTQRAHVEPHDSKWKTHAVKLHTPPPPKGAAWRSAHARAARSQ